MYQGSAVACAMFLTGQASNILGAGLALKLVNVEVTWSSWFISAIVPGIVSCVVVPWVVHRVVPPEITRTPAGGRVRARELERMGPLGRESASRSRVFAGIGLLWLTSGWHRLDVTFVALLGLATLLLTGTLRPGIRSPANGRRGTCSSGTAAC